MKNIAKSLLILMGIMAMSCTSDDTEDRPVIHPAEGIELLAPADGAAYTLAIEDAALQIERFVWTEADFGQDVAITYSVEMDNVGNNFAAPRVIGSSASGNNASVTVETLNGAANALGATPFVANQFEVRVKAAVNDTFEPVYSNVVTITVTPYVAIAPKLYLVGNSQQYYGLNAWDNTTAMEMRYIGNGTTKVFEAYVKVGLDGGNPAGLKFIGEQGSWDNGNYGVIGGMQDGHLENSGGSGDVKPGATDGPGFYYIWVDIDNLEYKTIKMNWGIIGDATPGGWGAETPMTYNEAANKFTITTTLGAGEMKFRSKNTGDYIFSGEWKFNVGNSDPKVAYDVNAPNFAPSAGPHTIDLSIGIQGEATVSGL